VGFKPNSAFQTAGSSIMESKENYNHHNAPGNNNNGMQHQVSQMELLSQLQ